jgi:hypothetical protein
MRYRKNKASVLDVRVSHVLEARLASLSAFVCGKACRTHGFVFLMFVALAQCCDAPRTCLKASR